MWIPAVFVIFGVFLNVQDHKRWGWAMIVLGVLGGIAVIL
jgi:hypothetical protein